MSKDHFSSIVLPLDYQNDIILSMKHLILFMFFFGLSASAKSTAQLDCQPILDKTLLELKDQVEGCILPLDRPPPEPKTYDLSWKLAGASYIVPEENARYEKLDGYDDIYIISNHYDPTKHPGNVGFLGSSAIVKVDRTTKPFSYIYLSKESHNSYSKDLKTLPYKLNVNEHLCTLNQACFKKLETFTKITNSTEFDQKSVSQFKSTCKSLIQDLFMVDIYRDHPEIKSKTDKVLNSLQGLDAKSIQDVEKYLSSELGKITDEKIGNKTFDQYSDKNEFLTYRSIKTNVNYFIQKYGVRMKKDSILEYCKYGPEPSCKESNSLRQDLEYFNSKRKVISKEEYLPES